MQVHEISLILFVLTRLFVFIWQHTGRLRGKITESLLGDLEPDGVPETRLPPRV